MEEQEDPQTRIRKLEATLRKLNKENKTLRTDLEESNRKCQEHFQAAQNLMRYELRIPETYDEAKSKKTVQGVVSGTSATFTLGPPE